MNLKIIIVFAIFCTFCLIGLGGYVHNTGSSLACPDWPLCYGQVMPEMKGGILIEHSHRLLGSLVGFLTILIVVFSFKNFSKNSRIFKFSMIALAMVITQGILGGITVIYKLPTLVSTAHLGLSMIFFCTLIYLHHLVVKAGEVQNNKLPSNWSGDFKISFFIVGCILYFQIILGALMRHLGLGGACGVGSENSIFCSDMIQNSSSWFPASSEAQLHFFHRILAVVLSLLIFFLVAKFFPKLSIIKNENKKIKTILKWMLALVLFIIAQVVLGVFVVAKNIPEVLTMLHLWGALLSLLSVWKIYLHTNDLETASGEKIYSKILDLLSLTKPRLSGLVIFTAAIGLYMNPGSISFFKGMLALITTSLIVAGACVLNCYTEKDEDALMKRTADRPLPSGRISKNIALNLGIGLVVVNILIQFLFINFTTGMLGLIATIVYIFLYTPMKKISWLAVFVGAIPGAIPPLMGWTSVSESFEIIPLVLFGILFVWQLPHFLSISIYHSEDYKQANFKVLPNLKGNKFTMTQMALYTIVLLGISLVPMMTGYAESYRNFSIFIGFAFLMCAILGIFNSSTAVQSKKWAKKYFWGSLLYLPAILMLIIVYKK